MISKVSCRTRGKDLLLKEGSVPLDRCVQTTPRQSEPSLE